MTSPKLVEIEDSIENLSLSETLWLLEKVVGQVRKLTQGVNASESFGQVNELTSMLTGVDPLIGLFEGPPDLASNSEEILQQEIREVSGWSWKEKSV